MEFALRSCDGTAQYLAAKRWDIQGAVREQSTAYVAPTVGDVLKQRRLIKYLPGSVAVGLFYEYQDDPVETVRVPVDADWAGEDMACTSVSNGGISHGAHLVDSWSVTQSTVAQSSVESEFYKMGSGVARGLTLQNVLNEMLEMRGEEPIIDVTLETDSAAADERDTYTQDGCGIKV